MKFIFTSAMLVAAAAGFAATDYSALNGLQGAALKEAVKKIALPHKEISYGDATWNAFSKCDVRVIWDPTVTNEDGENWREAWFDMYSNRLVWVSTGHSGMNIEHAVANSWWGGVRNAAYKDLHHLNPSDADANNRKSNNPLGEIDGTPAWSNGLTNMGRPKTNFGGGASTVFEPADEYKGDFARAYFYIFTVYDDIAWQDAPAYMYELTSYPTLQPWAYSMLLQWAAADPVDERETTRNMNVASIQENENPFVSIPGLADYIWGEKSNTPFNLEDAQTAPVRNRPSAPAFNWGVAEPFDLVGVNTWAGRWWDAFTINFMLSESEDWYYCITRSSQPDAEEKWEPGYIGINIPAAVEAGETLTVKAYATWWDEPERRSSISTLTLTATEPGTTDYRDARWVKVQNGAAIDTESQYILVASKAGAVMSTVQGSNKFMTVAGTVEPVNGEITHLPEDAAIIQFEEAGGNQYYVEVNDLALNPVGWLSSPEAKKVELAEEGMNATVTISADSTVAINFGSEFGTLQYNAQSPRFSVYTSKQQALDLYRCVENPSTSGVAAPASAEPCGVTRIFTLDGVEIFGATESELPAGIYIIATPAGARKIRR